MDRLAVFIVIHLYIKIIQNEKIHTNQDQKSQIFAAAAVPCSMVAAVYFFSSPI